MREYEFTLVLGRPEESEEDAARLYEAGCSDGTVTTRGGVTRIDFQRRAERLEDASRSAAADVLKAGFYVDRVELDPASLIPASAT